MLAIAFAGFAVYLQQSQTSGRVGFSASGLYRSDLLDDEVSIEQLRIIALSERFRSVVGGTVEIEDVADSAYFIRVTTTAAEGGELDHAHKTAIALLSTNMRDMALADVNSDIRYLEESRKASAYVAESRDEVSESQPSQEYYVKHLSSQEIKRFSQLEEENKKLRSFLKDGALDKSLEPMLMTGRVRAARERLRKQEAELKRIARSFNSDTKAFQAQQSLTHSTRDDYLALLRNEATHLLRANEHEYETLDDKAAGFIEESARSNSRKKSKMDERPLTQAAKDNQAFLSERMDVLRKRADVIKAASELKLKGEIVYTERATAAYPLTIACWVAALLCLLSALFVVGRGRVVSRVSETSAPTRRSPSHPVTEDSPTIRIDLSGLAHRFAGEASVDHLDGFFASIVAEIKGALGRQPRRILVLGDSPIESRLSFSIRLANVLGRTCNRIRLIDFDFQSQSLSERLGRQNLPGVADLLLKGGPVDEFFSSISGTKIQFAPAGSERVIEGEVNSLIVDKILGQEKGEMTVIDASSASPLHIIVNQVDAVLCTSHAAPGRPRSSREQQVLVAFRDAGLPVWGVSVESTQFFPLL